MLQVLQKSSAQSPQMAGPSQPPSFMSTSPFALDNINPPTNIDVLSEVAQLLSAQSQPFAQEHSSPAYPVGQTSSFLPVDQMGMAPATSSDIPAQSYDRRLASDAQTSWPSSQGTSSQSSGAAKMHPVGSGVMSPKDSQDSGSLQPPSKEADVGVSEGSDIYASDSEDGSTAQVSTSMSQPVAPGCRLEGRSIPNCMQCRSSAYVSCICVDPSVPLRPIVILVADPVSVRCISHCQACNVLKAGFYH